MIVETYSTANDLADHIHVTKNASDEKVVTQNGVTIRYALNDLTAMKIAIDGVPEAILVEYPVIQSEKKLLQDAERLSLVK